jgi:actin-like ATPase involved in cell morphogenesis
MYALGVDLGTTFTAAATWRAGHAEVASLGSRAAVIPSVVLLREDETVLTGETASRRGLSEPHRVAREFKRRLGDTTPILLGGVPYSAEALMGRMLRSVVDAVATREGGPPSAVCVSHPANWGPYKIDLIRQAVRLAGLEIPVSYTTEPEAAAVFYARQQRVDPGAVVAVYDLGGGTFDAAVLRKTQTGFEILGQPEGIERLGGIDVDAAVFAHVSRALGGKLQELDEDDPVVIAAVARLREECVQAKEALSSDTDVAIAVLLPNLSTEVRLTRSELEAMVRPALYSSVEALKRALRSAGVSPEQLHSVLLVGGSSRMPIVAQLVGAELGRPVAVDAHPKHAVALGASWLASTMLAAPGMAGAAGMPAGPGPRPPVIAGPPVAGLAVGGVPVAPVSGYPVSGPPVSGPPVPVSPSPLSGYPVSSAPVSPAVGSAPVSPAFGPPSAVGSAAVPVSPSAAGPVSPGGPPPTVYGSPPPPSGGSSFDKLKRRPLAVVAAGVAVLVLLTVGGIALASTFRDDGQKTNTSATSGPTSGATTGSGVEGPGATQSAEGSPTASPSGEAGTGTNTPLDEQCTTAIKANPRWVCITAARFDGTWVTIDYEANWAGGTPNVNGGYHLHVYGGDGTTPADRVMGSQAGAGAGRWYVEDKNPSKVSTSMDQYQVVANKPKVCARIANNKHALVADNSGNGTYKTGNCFPVTRV